MKKLLSIIVLGLLLSVNAYAADKNIYLSCKSIVFKNGNEGAFATKKNLEVGSYVGHFFYKFKDKKKTTTVTVYEQGNTITEDWSNMKPKQASKSKFDYDKDKVIYTGGGTDPSGLTFGWAIQKKNNSCY